MVSTSLFDLVALRKNLEEYGIETEEGFEGYERGAYTLLMRYGTAQSIDGVIPGHLYLGNRERARDNEYLASIGVTDVLVMGSLPSDDQMMESCKLRFRKVIMPDAMGFPIMAILRSALHYVVSEVFCGYEFPKFNLEHIGGPIKRHQSPNGRVLFVHCMQGVSRSASFVILYIMFRIFLSLDSESKAMVPLTEILAKVQQVRQSCPNPSFFCQLQLMTDCLTALLLDAASPDGVGLYKLRLSQFDRAMSYCEVYFESGCRCMGETIAYIGAGPVRSLRELANRSLSLGLLVWSTKSSPLRKSHPWFFPALLLESLVLYARASSIRGLMDVSRQSDFEMTKNLVQFRYRQTGVVNRTGKDPQAIHFATLEDFRKNMPPDPDGSIPKLNFISDKILNEQPDISRFTYPSTLFFTIQDPVSRVQQIGQHLNGKPAMVNDQWNPLEVVIQVQTEVDQLQAILESMLVRFK